MSTLLKNKQAIIDYIKAGSKGADMGRIGLEVEHFMLDEDGESLVYREKHSRAGSSTILESLTQYFPHQTRTDAGDLISCKNEIATMSLEPGSQIEFALAPKTSLAEIYTEYSSFLRKLTAILSEHDYSLATVGYHPSAKALDIDIIPRPRYIIMDKYFATLADMHAERMMRATASLQVSIDFADEQDAIRKTRIATLLGPILSFLADNCTVFEGKVNRQHLRRMQVWRQVDKDRCGVIPGLFKKDFSFEKYAEWMLSKPLIVSTHNEVEAVGDMTSAQYYKDKVMSNKDIEHMISMFWPDVRIKRFIEIRVADSLPIKPALAYTALIKGLFYGMYTLDFLEHALKLDDDTVQYCEKDVEDAINTIISDGFDACVYGKTMSEWIDLLFRIAPMGLGTEFSFLQALRDFRAI